MRLCLHAGMWAPRMHACMHAHACPVRPDASTRACAPRIHAPMRARACGCMRTCVGVCVLAWARVRGCMRVRVRERVRMVPLHAARCANARGRKRSCAETGSQEAPPCGCPSPPSCCCCRRAPPLLQPQLLLLLQRRPSHRPPALLPRAAACAQGTATWTHACLPHSQRWCWWWCAAHWCGALRLQRPTLPPPFPSLVGRREGELGRGV